MQARAEWAEGTGVRVLSRLLPRRGADSRGASAVEYGLVISLLLVGSLATIDSMDERIEDNYQDTADDIGQVDLAHFNVSTTAPPSTSSTTPPSTSSIPAPTPELERTIAEATITGDMTSDGTGVGVPNGTGNNWSGPSGTTSSIEFEFTVTQTGTYRVEGEILAPTSSDNSFWVQVNGEPAIGYEWRQGEYTSYTWEYVNDGSGSPPVEFPLEPGDHTVTLYNREDGTYLSGLRLVLQ